MAKRSFFLWCTWLLLPIAGGAQVLPGDVRVAEQYLAGAETALAAGRRAEALSVLERGADFSGDSSDISFLLGRVRFEAGKPAGAVLEALRRARETNRWSRYSPEAARLLEAEILIRLRSYEKARELLIALPRSAAGARLALQAARFQQAPGEFRRLMEEALDRYPRESWPLRVLFSYGEGRTPAGNEGDLMARALGRLPLLLDDDPDLAPLAFPFIQDLEEARRLVAAYRALGGREKAALPAALSLGLLNEEDAVEELFTGPGEAELRLDKDLVLKVGRLLLSDGGREYLRRNLLGFSGVITEDVDGDGYPEALARYREGLITEYHWDGDQDGLPELKTFFGAGVPFRAELAILSESSAGGEAPVFASPRGDEDLIRAVVRWEQYPAVLESALEGVRYIPRPRDFFYAPFRLEDLGGMGLLFPEGDSGRVRLSRRTLSSFAAVLERPSTEFTGALERIELNRGIPERAREFLDGRLVAETEFSRGRPVLQRIDLDLDGRRETVRYFRPVRAAGVTPGYSPEELSDYRRDIEFSESDWDGDGIFEFGEQYLSGESGETVIRTWDLDRDGVRETGSRRAD